jgi:AmmeMemoRadiSam system protein B
MPDDLRRAAVAGHFYPADPVELRRVVAECLEGVAETPRRSIAAIAPHAGLIYSGRCAGAVFGRLPPPKTIVILAPNHTGVCDSPGASLWRSGAFETPLGPVRVDEPVATALLERCDLVAHDPAAHRHEHAIEVELPFIAVRAPGATIVPLVIAWDDWPRSERLATALAGIAEEVRAAGGDAQRILLLASSDMNHHESADVAARKDAQALAAIEALDGRGLLDVCARERITMCGRAPAAIVLEAARRLGATAAQVVDYRHSGLVSGSNASVVSYAGVLIDRI